MLGVQHPRPRANWARISGPALPMDGGKVLCKSLGYAGRPGPERWEIDEKYQKVGKSTQLVGGLEHVFHRLGIIIPID